MINTDKMRQVIISIQDVGITNYTTTNLARLLSILNENEIDEIIKRSYKIFGCGQTGSAARQALEEAKPLALLSINNRLRKIKNSKLIPELNRAINTNDLDNFLSVRTTTELGEIKYYILSYLVNIEQEESYRRAQDIINKIDKTILNKDSQKTGLYSSSLNFEL